MAFGKRISPPSKPGAETNARQAEAKVSATSPNERYAAWSAHMLAIVGACTSVAVAIRENDVVELLGLDSELHPDTTPIDVKGIEAHFSISDDGRTMHPVYGYVQATAPKHVDQSGQLHLHQLVARVMELNLYCQRAVRDDALRVALQSPKLPPIVDRILVSGAFFVAFFENLAITQPAMIRGDNPVAMLLDRPELATNLERRMLLARDRMLAPETADELMPWRKLPFIGVETATKPHAGQKFHQGVYFPVGMAPVSIGGGIRASSALSAA